LLSQVLLYNSEVVSAIKKEKEITEKTEEKLVEAITKFKEEFK
jgi:hypothetical protein